MGLPLRIKEYTLTSRTGESLKVRIEKLGVGEKADIVYRIIRGEDRKSLPPDKVALYKEELEQLVKMLQEDFLKAEFPE
jgi:hypothetical protein